MGKTVLIRVVRDDGDSMEFGTGTDWYIENDGLENWSAPTPEVSYSENVTYDGATVTGRRVASIDRTIEATLRNAKQNELMRERVVRFFNPKHSYEAHITYQGRTLWCHGEHYAFKCDAGNVYQPVSFSWTILCPMPYLLSEDDFGQDIAAIDPKFGFPLYSCTSATGAAKGVANRRGFIWSAYSFARTVEIANDGDVPTYCKAIIIANGTVTNPKLIKGTSYVRIVDTLQEGDVVEIDLVHRPPTVTKNGENIIQRTDRASSFSGVSFDVGLNTIQYDADDGSDALSVAIYYNKRYLGV